MQERDNACIDPLVIGRPIKHSKEQFWPVASACVTEQDRKKSPTFPPVGHLWLCEEYDICPHSQNFQFLVNSSPPILPEDKLLLIPLTDNSMWESQTPRPGVTWDLGKRC
jgi:hypothetical protein